MADYMSFTQGAFNDVLKTLGIVDYYIAILDAEVAVKSAEMALNKAISELNYSFPSVRDEIYAYVMERNTGTTDKVEALKGILTRFREARVADRLGAVSLRTQIASEAAALFTTFDEAGFMQACEDTKLMAGKKEANTAVTSCRAALSKANKVLAEARAAYKVGIFTENSAVWSITDEVKREEFAVDRAKSFVSVWKHRQKLHSAAITIECTDIKSLPDAGGVKKTWNLAHAKLMTGLERRPAFIARTYKEQAWR